MDRLDRKILRLLQEDATLAVADVAKKVGLSTTPCWRRIQKLEEEGVIKRRVAILDPRRSMCGSPSSCRSAPIRTAMNGCGAFPRSSRNFPKWSNSTA